MGRKRAKQLLELALMELLLESSLDKIDVRELTIKAGLSRQTFYYNFKNKQDMVTWILEKNNDMAKQAFWQKHLLYDYVLTLLKTIANYQLFYINVLIGESAEHTSPGAFEKGIINSVQELELHCSAGRMNSTQWNSLLFFAFGTLGMVKYWLTNNIQTSAEDMAGNILDNIPPYLNEYIESCRK